MKLNPRLKAWPRCAVTLTAMLAAATASATVINKADNATALNVGGSWVGGVVPGVSDIAQWDNALATSANTTNTLGANLSWSGVKLIDPAEKIQLNAGNTLTIGSGGIDMSAATVDLALSNAVTIAPGTLQQWNLAGGRSLSVLAVPFKPGRSTLAAPDNTGVLQVGTTGTVKLGAAATSIINDNQGNPWVTYGLNDWAALDSSGNVIAATYTPTAGAIVPNVNNDIVTDIGGGAASAVFVSSVRFNDSTFRTLNIANSGTTRTFSARGVLVTANCAGGLIGGQPATSFIRGNASTSGATQNTSFNVIQNSPADFTISANLANNSGSTPNHLVKSGPGNLILSHTGNGYTGGTDINGGTLTAAAGASLGGGVVNINNTGRLIVNASNTTFVAGIAVNSGATNTIKINSAGAQQFTRFVNFIGGSSHCEFNYGSGIAPSITTAPLLVSNVTANGSITVDVFNSSLTVGTYPLIKYTNSLTGVGFGAFVLGFLPPRVSGYLSNDTVNTSISLVVTSVNQPVRWAVGNANWDVNSTANWKDAADIVTTYQQIATPYSSLGDNVLLNDNNSGSSPITVTLNVPVAPGSIVVSNNTKDYTISGSGGMNGITSLTKTGSGTLTLGTANAFSGGLNLNGGTVNFSAMTNLGGGAINFSGGTLQYNGNSDDIAVRTVTFNVDGATIDTAGQTIGLSGPIGGSGTGGLTKAGAGTLTLAGTNRYSGNTVVANGTLALGGNTFISNSAAIIVNNGAILDASSSGLTFRGSPVQTLAGSGTVNGSVISSNGVITPGTNGVVGTLTFGSDLTVAGGSLNLDLANNPAQRDLIVINGSVGFYGGTLQLNVAGTLTNGVYKLIQYAGGLSSGASSSANLNITGYSPVGKSITLSDAIAGEIDLIVADTASDNVVWSGTGADWDVVGSFNWLKGVAAWAYTNGDFVTFDETGSSQPGVNLQALVTPSSVVVSNGPTTYTFVDGTGVGGGKISGPTSIVKQGPGTLVIATPNNNTGPTDLQGGTLQIGNGGTMGDFGIGNVTNNGTLTFSHTDNHSVSGVISGSGSLFQQGSGIVTLSANNTYAGPTTLTSGSLQVGTGGAAGSLGSGAITNDGTLIYNRSGSLTVGNIKTGSANAGALTFNGSAAVTLNGGNTYINNTTVSGGVLTLAAANVVPNSINTPGSTGWLAVDGTGKVDVNGINLAVNALSGNNATASITNSATAVTTNLITVLGTAATAFNGAITENPTGSKLALTLLGTGELRLNGNSAYSGLTQVGAGATLGVGPGYITAVSPVILSNGATFYLHNNGSTSVFPGNTLLIADNSDAMLRTTALANGFGGQMTGGSTATNSIVGDVSISSTTKQFQGLLGTVYIATGNSLRFSSTGLNINGGDNATFDIAGGALNTRNGTGSGAGVSLGALQGTGNLNGAGNADGNGIYVIGAKGIDTTFSGGINGVVPRNTSIVKTGAGTLTLDGTLSYDGSTTVNGGVLKIASVANPATSLDTSATLTLTSNAVLDVSDRSDATLNLGNSIAQTLSGYGTIRGSLNEAASSTVNVGLGTLTITNAAVLNGALNMQLNRTNGAVTNSTLAAASFVIAGPLTVTNIGPALQAGDTFKLFNIGVTGFTVTNLPTLTSPLYWTNNLAVNGTIAVINPVNTTPTNISSSVSGNTLTLTWPTDHIGWRLQSQTNALGAGLNVNPAAWTEVPGSAGVNTMNFTIDPLQPTVFYRMVYP